LKKIKITTPTLIGLGILGLGVYVIWNFSRPPPPVEVFQKPPPTNAFVPDPSIDEWSYQNAIRKDYEAMVRLETHPYNEQARQWNVGNIHPSYARYLRKKYF
jgi:hypothetical protein